MVSLPVLAPTLLVWLLAAFQPAGVPHDAPRPGSFPSPARWADGSHAERLRIVRRIAADEPEPLAHLLSLLKERPTRDPDGARVLVIHTIASLGTDSLPAITAALDRGELTPYDAGGIFLRMGEPALALAAERCTAENPAVRMRAVLAVYPRALRLGLAVPPPADLLLDPQREIRLLAIDLLSDAELQRDDVLERLLELAARPAEPAAAAALRRLSRSPEMKDAALPTIARIAGDSSLPRDQRAAAISVLVTFGKDPRSLATLKAAMTEPGLASAAAAGLAAHAAEDPEIIPLLVEALPLTEDWYMGSNPASDALVTIGAPAVAPLLAALDSPNEASCRAAAAVLARFGADAGPRAAAYLLDRVEAWQPGGAYPGDLFATAAAAAGALADDPGRARVRRALTAAADRASAAADAAGVRHGADIAAASAAIVALGRIRPASEELLRTIAAHLEPGARFQVAAIDAAAQLGPDAAPLAPALAKIVASAGACDAADAALAGAADKRRSLDLVMAAIDEFARRRHAAGVLRRVGVENPAALTAVLEYLATSEWVRPADRSVLSEGDMLDGRRLVHESEQVTGTILWALVPTLIDHPDLLDRTLNSLKHRPFLIAQLAMVERETNGREYVRLPPWAVDAALPEWRRRRALTVIARYGRADAETKDLIRSLANPESDLAGAAALALASLEPDDPTTVPRITALLDDARPAVAAQAAAALGHLGPRAAGSAPAVAGLLDRFLGYTGSMEAAVALGSIGNRSPEVVAALHRAARHPTEYIAAAARRSLDQLGIPPASP